MSRVTCPHCQKVIKFSVQHQGKVAKCPGCQQKLRLPAAPVPEALPAPETLETLDDPQWETGGIGQNAEFPVQSHEFPGAPLQNQQQLSPQAIGAAAGPQGTLQGKKKLSDFGVLKWLLIIGVPLFLVISLLATFVLLWQFGFIFSQTPETAFKQWRTAIGNNDYEGVYDMLSEDLRTKIAADAGISMQAAKARFCKNARRMNKAYATIPGWSPSVRARKYGHTKFTETEISKDGKTAIVYFEFAEEFAEDSEEFKANIHGKKVMMVSQARIHFNYLDFVKEDNQWKLSNYYTAWVMATH